MNRSAKGSFEVKIDPQPVEAGVGDPMIGRMALSKVFSGDIEAAGSGQMLGFRTATSGSAGYVAIERVVGTVHGKSGSFVLQHSGIMDRGSPELKVRVVPDSGTDELEGIEGTLAITIVDGGHFYAFDYVIGPTPVP